MQAQTSPAAGKRLWLKLAGALAVAAIAGVGYFSMSAQAKAPDVSFTNLKGEKIALQSLRGKVVMVNFWATSCTTCVQEMPQMIETYNKYKGQGLDFVAVAMSYDPPNYVLNFTETRQLPFHVALDVQDTLAQVVRRRQADPDHLRDRQGRQRSSSAMSASRSSPNCTRCWKRRWRPEALMLHASRLRRSHAALDFSPSTWPVPAEIRCAIYSSRLAAPSGVFRQAE